MTTDTQIIQRFTEHGLRYAHLPLQQGAFLLVGERGGRVFGPFLQPGSHSLYWVNPVFNDPAVFAAALAEGFWNQGGERVWIAPEIQYFVHDRRDFWGSNHLPSQMDPGHFTLAQSGPQEITLENACTLTAHNTASGQKSLHWQIQLSPLENPLHSLPQSAQLLDGVQFLGYQQVVTLAEMDSTPIQSECWNLVQLNPGGVLLIPASRHFGYHDYFEPIDAAHQRYQGNHIQLRLTGQRRYKIGYLAAHLTGRAGYFNHLADGRAMLLIRNYFNNPSAPYLEEPPHLPGAGGHSLHVYNDGGMFGCFGELEVNGQAIGGASGRSSSSDAFGLWIFLGDTQRLQPIAEHLLGIQTELSIQPW